MRGIFSIPMIGFDNDFFSFHTATKEKKQKNVVLLPLDFVLMLVKEKLYSVILWLIDKVKQMETIQIKGITLNDIEQLQQIGRQTFYETFSAGNTETGASPVATCPSLRALLFMLKQAGFTRVDLIKPPPGSYEQHRRGKRVVCAAYK